LLEPLEGIGYDTAHLADGDPVGDATHRSIPALNGV
jgi:hypothetical protein